MLRVKDQIIDVVVHGDPKTLRQADGPQHWVRARQSTHHHHVGSEQSRGRSPAHQGVHVQDLRVLVDRLQLFAFLLHPIEEALRQIGGSEQQPAAARPVAPGQGCRTRGIQAVGGELGDQLQTLPAELLGGLDLAGAAGQACGARQHRVVQPPEQLIEGAS